MRVVVGWGQAHVWAREAHLQQRADFGGDLERPGVERKVTLNAEVVVSPACRERCGLFGGGETAALDCHVERLRVLANSHDTTVAVRPRSCVEHVEVDEEREPVVPSCEGADQRIVNRDSALSRSWGGLGGEVGDLGRTMGTTAAGASQVGRTGAWAHLQSRAGHRSPHTGPLPPHRALVSSWCEAA